MHRINYLDGHRGVAILLVFMFHAFARRPELMPYGNSFAEFQIFQYGYLGVQLFFLISGFVILMTLEKCNHITSFIYHRWLRLFPAMLICSLLIFFTAALFIERPNGQPEFKDLIAGLSFVDPYIWLKITGISLQSIEGAFWSLYVEFKFYIIAAILYYKIGSQKLVYALFLCFISWVLLSYIEKISPNKLLSLLYSIASICSFKYFGWFSAGAAYYLYIKNNNKKWFVLGILFSFTSTIVESELQLAPFFAAMFISCFFAASIVSTKLQTIISHKLFLFFGFISYPLYLLHENMMVSIVIKLDNYTKIIPSYLFPLVALIFISVLSYFISKYAEPFVKDKIRYFFVKRLNQVLNKK